MLSRRRKKASTERSFPFENPKFTAGDQRSGGLCSCAKDP